MIVKTLRRAAKLITSHRLLLILGILIVLAGGGAGDSTGLLAMTGLIPEDGIAGLPDLSFDVRGYAIGWLFTTLGARYDVPGIIASAVIIALVIVLLGVILLILRGALIWAGAQADADTPITIGEALKRGWQRAGALLVVASIPAIPVTLAAIIIVVITFFAVQQMGGVEALDAPLEELQTLALGLTGVGSIIGVPLAVISALLIPFRHMAARAAVLERVNAIRAYRRAWEVFRANFSAVIPFVIVILLVERVIGLLLIAPRLAVMLCTFGAPLLWLIVGAVRAWMITVWTLVWREWTQVATDR